MRTLLVDVDSIIYAAAATNEMAVQWDENTYSVSGDFDGARRQLDQKLTQLQENLDANHMVLALTDSENPWRLKVLPSYKGNRKDVRRPILLKPLRDYTLEVYNTFLRSGLEADDCCGILATAESVPEPIDGERVICSIDKDLRTIPGLLYNWNSETMESISEEQADRNHMMQTLTGDTTDGYKGCPKVGPVKAEKILGDAKTVQGMWPLVVQAFNKAGLSEEDALTQARVARICRANDFDFKKREVKLWQPA